MRKAVTGSITFDLIVYVVVIAACLGALAWAEQSIKEFFVKPEREHWTGVVAGKDAEILALTNTNKLVGAQVVGLKSEIKTCNDSVDSLKKDGDAASKRAADALAAKDKATQAAKAAADKLRALAQGPPVSDACVQADAILSDLSRDVRAIFGLDHPPASAPQ